MFGIKATKQIVLFLKPETRKLNKELFDPFYFKFQTCYLIRKTKTQAFYECLLKQKVHSKCQNRTWIHMNSQIFTVGFRFVFCALYEKKKHSIKMLIFMENGREKKIFWVSPNFDCGFHSPYLFYGREKQYTKKNGEFINICNICYGTLVTMAISMLILI